MAKKKMSPKASKLTRIILMCVFATVFVVSAFMLINTMFEYDRATDLYGKIHEDFMDGLKNVTETDGSVITAKPVETRDPDNGWGTIAPDTTEPPETSEPDPEQTEPDNGDDPDPVVTMPPPPEYSEYFLSVREKIMKFKEVNDEIFGYILIEFGKDDTISYPLVQGEDNYFYVDHAYDKSELKAGSIFLDYRNHTNFEKNAVSVLFGHNMNNEAMFHKLSKFKEKSYFDNTKITVFTMDGIYTYEAFSVYNTTIESDYAEIYFDGRDAYFEYLNSIKARSILHKDITLNKYDKILTLSTCLNTYNKGRLAVHAVLVGIAR